MKRSALVTGSSRGIGYSIAEQLLTEGYDVFGTSTKDESPFENTLYTHIQLPLNDIEGVKATLESLECPDVIINNAGIFREASIPETVDKDWLNIYSDTLNVNLIAPSLISKWAMEHWIDDEREGIIINIASRAAYRGDTQEYAAYAASKGGLVAFTKSIARSFGKMGITAFSISPGFVRTDMAIGSIETYGEEYLTKDLALNDIIPPEEVANLCSLLASGKLSHATGQNFHMNSGSYLL